MTTNANANAAATATATRSLPPPPTRDAPAIARFPDFPPRNDIMNTRHLHDHGHQPALRRYLGNPDTTIVLGEVPIAWDIPRRRADVRIPDLLVAFNVRPDRILDQKGYAIRQEGKPPDFVLEVASDTTSRQDETVKRRDYAAFRITEYWLFDPDWGQRYEAGLIGWTLVNGRYELITIHEYAPGMYYGYSAVLELYVCWEHGRLRWYDPAARRYLRSYDEEQDNGIAVEAQRDEEHSGRIAAETQREEEHSGRIAAETQRDEERSGRIVAEAQRDAAEAEVRRLQNEIARLRAAAEEA